MSIAKYTLLVSMTETRAKFCIYLIGQPQQHFAGRVLPTTLEMLKVYLCYHKKEGVQQKDAVKSVVKRIGQIWAKARIPITQKRNIVRKTEYLLDKYRNLCRSKNRGVSTQTGRGLCCIV